MVHKCPVDKSYIQYTNFILDLDSPNLIVLDSRRVLVQWTPPTLPNGIITTYTILFSLSTETALTTAGTVNATVMEFTVSGNVYFNTNVNSNLRSITMLLS